MKLNRHLLPHEFDLLLDGEVGFGMPELAEHVRGCTTCRSELDDAIAVMAQVNRLPHLSPSWLFAEKVMFRVHVFRPWYVTAVDLARSLVPRPGPIRTLVAAGGILASLTLTAMTFWVATRAEAAFALAGLAFDRLRPLATSVASAVLGPDVGAVLAGGGVVTAATLAGILVVSAALAAGGIARAVRVARASGRLR